MSSDVFRVVSEIYARADDIFPDIDIRVLLPGSSLDNGFLYLSDDQSLDAISIIPDVSKNCEIKFTNEIIERVNVTCLGGTFDNLHAAHKMLLSEAIFLAKNRIVIGMATGDLLANKFLPELIQPLEVRLQHVESFVKSVQSHLKEIDVVPISDPFGPAATDPDIDVIVVSSEVENAVPLINSRRAEDGLKALGLHVAMDGIMIEDSKVSADITKVTDTISSSAGRARSLGQLRFPPYKPQVQGKPYVIGLTGMLASGKSSVAKRLEGLGAYKVDADKMGHKAYSPATNDCPAGPAYQTVIDYFGRDILADDDLTIDRRKLGGKVFNNPGERRELERIVWPAIEQLCKQEIDQAADTHSVIVVEGLFFHHT